MLTLQKIELSTNETFSVHDICPFVRLDNELLTVRCLTMSDLPLMILFISEFDVQDNSDPLLLPRFLSLGCRTGRVIFLPKHLPLQRFALYFPLHRMQYASARGLCVFDFVKITSVGVRFIPPCADCVQLTVFNSLLYSFVRDFPP